MDTRTAVGIDFGGTSVKIGVVQGTEVVDQAPPIATQDYPDAPSLIDDIARSIESLRGQFPDLAAVGVGVPGFVDLPTGTIHNLTNVAGWKLVPIRDELSKRTGLPVHAENDANAMAYAEWKLGAGKGFNHLVALTLGTGVGGGLIIDGRLARGAQYVGGELGQTSIQYDGRVGAYGNRGALEDYIGNREIASDAHRRYEEAGQPRPLDLCSPKHLAEAANADDEIALAIWDDIAQKLACALVNCCFLLNPEAIVIGGGVAKAGKVLFDPLKEHLWSQLGDPFKEHLQILPAQFGNEAGILGAAHLALEGA
jgi:glucokinase